MICKCGKNSGGWESYFGMDDGLYITCTVCGSSYDFELLLKLAIECGVTLEQIERQE